ncbi:MBL fold metallo-hydrolase [Cupriavidus sp. amp6]|uniref:MBL fold metallo-hydrolase n=1 Tax=Cupriavidus sp. amp6 TaxID=388051 RepID=UPI000A07B0E0|nr:MULTISPECIES: MBL fold metallo-hydrolase [unclassified Cupriavidus]MBP0633108.1 MBL fold metallo-hydrolase [Cupriavidus sp. AcVe19-1a]
MILRQFLHDTPVGASYLIGCGGRGVAAIVDPIGEPEVYLQATQAGGMRIAFVIDTHVHADHLSSAKALADRAGAEYVLFADADIPQPPPDAGTIRAINAGHQQVAPAGAGQSARKPA